MPKNGEGDDKPGGYRDRDRRSLQEEESRVRSKFSNERTFASWVRTGLSLVVVGLAAGQFLAQEGRFEIPFLLLGGGFVLAGVGLFWYAALEYRRSRKQMKRADFHAPRKGLVVVSIVLSILSLGLLGVIAFGAVG